MESIIDFLTKDTLFTPIKHNTRQHLITPIIVVNSLDDITGKTIHAKKMGCLDFWNEISGWFHANVNCEDPHPVYIVDGCETEIPSDIKVRSWSGKTGGLISPIVAGTYIVDSEYQLYRIYGWDKVDGRADIYFDFI